MNRTNHHKARKAADAVYTAALRDKRTPEQAMKLWLETYKQIRMELRMIGVAKDYAPKAHL